MRHPIGLLLFLVCIPALAQVYKWVDENGVVHYTDQPPSKEAGPAKLPPLQTYKGGTVPPLDKFTKPGEPTAAPATTTVTITSPAPDQTFRSDSESRVTVSVRVAPALKEAEQLVYYLDGKAQGAPTKSSSQTLSGLERGTHDITVAVVAGGKELSRSQPVTVHMKQATVRK